MGYAAQVLQKLCTLYMYPINYRRSTEKQNKITNLL